jgi:hypothetical protein
MVDFVRELEFLHGQSLGKVAKQPSIFKLTTLRMKSESKDCMKTYLDK